MNISDTSTTTGKLYYRTGGEREFRQLSMKGPGNTLTGEIPADALKMGVSYYLEAEDVVEHVSTYPDKGSDAPIGVVVSGAFAQQDMFPAQAWHLFSVPVTAATPNLESLLDNTLGQDNWAADIWNGTTNVRAKQPIAVPGNPFWLISKTPFQLKVTGETANPTTSQTLSLRQGWNLVANPYLFEVSFGNVQIMVDGNPLPLDNPKASNLVQPKFWRWTDITPNDITDGDYEMVTNLSQRWKPWSGYWVFAEAEATIRIAPFTEPIHQVTAAPATPIWDWLATLAIGNARGVSRVQLALAETARRGNDSLNVQQPPLPTRISVSLLQDGTRFQRLSLPTGADEWLWEAEIHAEANAQLMLSDSPLAGYHLYLEYLTDGTRVELDSNSPIPIPDGKHRVRIRLTKQQLGRYLESAIPTVTQLLHNYPNPFNPETWIPYQLAHDAEIQISIYDISGKMVRRLNLGHQKAGYYVDRNKATYWDGKSETGEQVSSGLYFYQLRAGDFTSVKRLVILK